MKILVTGVSGFVGGALGRHLQDVCGFDVTGVSRGRPRPRACGEFRPLDLSVPVPPDLGRFDALVHAAGLVSPWAHPDAYERHNVRAAANLLDFAARAAVPHVVFISSSSVLYRDGDQFDLSESTPVSPEPVNAYAATKLRAERLVEGAGVAATILRPRAVFGVGDTVLFPRVLRAARFGLLPRLVRPDKRRAVGDLVSIDNLVLYVEAALRKKAIGTFNLTDGTPVDIYGFLGSVLAALGLPAARLPLPVPVARKIAGAMEGVSAKCFGWREPPLTRFGVDVLSQSKTFDIAKAKAVLGPPAIPTAEAVARFVAWQKARPALGSAVPLRH